ncbi:hypothetical protein PGTUg99_025061 [Puccinia graminis f. sp. tritici]|uniref:Uncharacterized protein n=1 Tax=Puccinia graminis f. sp. tritici TaxID=56615 RepID=A0A5B0R9R8_PUCGR|nr:hypothetical protein PGTUg99_025061 [Puccinia graminis f. sp. tritici]
MDNGSSQLMRNSYGTIEFIKAGKLADHHTLPPQQLHCTLDHQPTNQREPVSTARKKKLKRPRPTSTHNSSSSP